MVGELLALIFLGPIVLFASLLLVLALSMTIGALVSD